MMRMMGWMSALLASAVLTAAPAAAWAGGGSGETSSVGMNISSQDRQFVVDATRSSRFEMKLSQLAVNKSSTPQVQTAARELFRDHCAATQKLSSLARENDISLPSDLTAEQLATLERLSSLSGEEFDREYLQAVAEEHAADVRIFDVQARCGQNLALRDFAEDTVPTLRSHWQMARTNVQQFM